MIASQDLPMLALFVPEPSPTVDGVIVEVGELYLSKNGIVLTFSARTADLGNLTSGSATR